MLLKNIDDLKVHLGRAVNRATTDEFLLPYVQLAQDEFVLPAIGQPMLTELDTQYNATVPTTLTTPNAALLKRLQRALAWYAYWKYLPFSIGNDGDNGLQEQATDKTAPVRIGVLEKRQRESIINASNAIESALQYLDQNKASYPTWLASDAYKATKDLFISSATGLTEHLPFVKNSYRLFLTLQPYLRRAERQAILPLVGQPMYDELKAYQLTNVISPVTERLIYSIGAAMSVVAYADSLFHLNVVQTPAGGLRIMSEFDGINNEKAPDDKLLKEAQSLAATDATRYLKALKKYLTDYADQYPTYKASPQYATPNRYDMPNNEGYKGIFRLR